MKIKKKIRKSAKSKLSGYLPYPRSEDIYKKDIETDIDPEKIAECSVKTEVGSEEEMKKENKDKLNTGLDVPGSELDDDREITGSEDEENNYYSIGGDNHTGLEEF